MDGKRFDGERKLNMKKVLSVILGLIVVVMFCFTLTKLLQDSTHLSTRAKEQTTNKYFSVYTNNKWGIINQKGEFIINPIYDEMLIVPDETKPIFVYTYDVDYKNETYKTRIINAKSEAQFTGYDELELITNHNNANVLWYENVIRVKNGEKYGLINFEGRELLKCEYDKIEPLLGVKNAYVITKDNKVGISDNFGNIIVEVKYKEVKKIGDDNKQQFIIVDDDNAYGVALSDKTVEIPCTYSDIKPLTQNNVYVVKEDGKWKIINADKSVNIETGFDDVMEMSPSYFVIKENNKYGVLNTKGEKVLPAEYDFITLSFEDNFVVQKDSKYGIINSAGEEKVAIAYEYISYRKDADLFEVTIESENHLFDKNFEDKLIGIISKVDAENGYLKIRVNGEYKLYDFKFEEKTNTEVFANNTIFLDKKDGKYGYVNKKGEVVVDYIYNDATEQNEYGYAAVNEKGKWGAINSEGKVVLEPTYTLENNVIINFIDKWHLSEDVNANYYTDK